MVEVRKIVRGCTDSCISSVCVQMYFICNTMKHTARQCKTLQHTATRMVWTASDSIVRFIPSATHSITLQHTTTLCRTLPRTATHCNTLQHTATQDRGIICWRSDLKHIVTHCNTLQHTAPNCNTLQHTATHCNIDQGTSEHLRLRACVPCFEEIHFTPQIRTQHIATHCNTLQHTATHCTTLQQTNVDQGTSEHVAWECVSLVFRKYTLLHKF